MCTGTHNFFGEQVRHLLIFSLAASGILELIGRIHTDGRLAWKASYSCRIGLASNLAATASTGWNEAGFRPSNLNISLPSDTLLRFPQGCTACIFPDSAGCMACSSTVESVVLLQDRTSKLPSSYNCQSPSLGFYSYASALFDAKSGLGFNASRWPIALQIASIFAKEGADR